MKQRELILAGGLAIAFGGCASHGGAASNDTSVDASLSTSTPSVDASGPWAVVPGASVGPITLGETYAQVKALLGAGKVTGVNHTDFVDWSDQGLELVFASSEMGGVSDDGVVTAIGLKKVGSFSGVAQPGVTLSALQASFGPPSDTVASIDYWASGVSAQLDANGTTATSIAVYTPYVPESQPAEMTASQGPALSPATPDPSAITTIDMHLHPGKFGRMPTATKQFIIGTIPAFTQLYAPAALASAIDPYAPFIGIQAETQYEAAQHAVLLAVYTQKTTGWFSNEDLEAVLTDPRNKAADGLPWAWGLASIDFFDGYVSADGTVDAQISQSRLAALGSYFAKRRDLFIGIKLAHAHQQIAFDDTRYLGVYDVASKYQVPVYLHTGFSPFPGAETTAPYYDPQGLENTIVNLPNVTFILGHVGQGDAAAVEHCLDLAQKYANVYLEVSALNLPLEKEMDGGEEPDGGEPVQYPYVMAQVKARGLIQKTIFGTDGPQYDGMPSSYAASIRSTMSDAGYTDAEALRVMSGTFLKVFFGVGS